MAEIDAFHKGRYATYSLGPSRSSPGHQQSITFGRAATANERTFPAPQRLVQRPLCYTYPDGFFKSHHHEFFTANIRNRYTRAAYARAVAQFARWCDARHVALAQLTPVIVAAYIEELGQHVAKPSVKQHLAALPMLFDYVVTGQVLPTNPAYAVRGPKHVVKTGRTPVLTAEETRVLLDHIDVNTIAGLRDRALIGVMVYSFARVGAVVGMSLEDYFQEGKRWWFRLHEKGGKRHEVPAHHNAEAYMDAYLAAAWIDHLLVL